MTNDNDIFQKALMYAYKLLSYRDRSSKEMHERIVRKGFPEGTAVDVVSFLEERGFLNDKKLAEVLHAYAINKKHLGKSGVRKYLLSRGITAEIIDTLSDADDDYIEAAKRLAEKKLRQMKDYDLATKRIKIWNILFKRGFPSHIINKTIKSIFSEEEGNGY